MALRGARRDPPFALFLTERSESAGHALMSGGPAAEAWGMEAARATAIACLDAFNAGDEAAYLACFAPEGGQSGPMAGPGLRGPAALKSLFRTLRAELPTTRFRIKRFYVRGREAAMAWEGQPKGDPASAFQGLTHLRFSASGLIEWADVYWDPAHVLAPKEGREIGAPSIPPPAQVFMQALDTDDTHVLRTLFSAEATLEGALSAGVLKGAGVVAQHLSHSRRHIGSPAFHLDGAFAQGPRVAVLWRADGALRSFRGAALLESEDGHRIDRVHMFWDPADLSG